jgi:PhnB protein
MPVKPVPEGYHTVTPLISVKGAGRLIDFLKEGFRATEIYRFNADDGSVMHAELKIGDSIVMLGEMMEGSPPMITALYLYVPDADATFKAAVQAGGKPIEKPEVRFWGDRAGSVGDFAGNMWWIATHVEDVSPEELSRRAKASAATSKAA